MSIDHGRSPSEPGCQPAASAAEVASSQSGIPNAGDTVFGSFGHFGTVDVKRGTIRKVTPKGQLVVDFGEIWSGNGEPRLRRFHGPKGSEIGGQIYKTGQLVSEDTYAMLAKKQAGAEAAAALVAHLRSWSWRTKAELNELVAKLIELADRVPDDESTASAIEAATAGETTEIGSTEGESAVGEAETPNPLSSTNPNTERQSL